jgi:hypothetical protein
VKPYRRTALTLFAFAMITSGSAKAAEPEDTAAPVRIVYRAPAACPDERSFVERFRTRAKRARPAWTGEAAPTLTVTLTTNGARASGTLHVVGAHGEASEDRTVTSSTCDEVVTAIALAAALTVDPSSGRAGAGDDTETASATTTTAAAATTPPPATPTAPVTAPARDGASPSSSPAHASRGEPWRFAVAALGTVHTGTSPELMLAPSIAAELRAPWRGHSAIRVGVARASSGIVPVPDGGARFTWTAALVDLCPWSVERGMVALSPCARVEAGAVEGEGERITPARSQTRPWFAAGAATRLRIAPTGSWFIEIEGGARAPLARERFVVHPDTTVFRAPAVAFFAGAGVGAQFP